MPKTRVLFVCIHNSARSQMAEAFLKKWGGDDYEVESAGIEPGKLNPVVVEALKQVGIDISGKGTQKAFDLVKAGKSYHFVITVCDETSAEKCPVFPGVAQRLHWGFPDPSALQGTPEDKLRRTAEIRDQIEAKVKMFVEERKSKA